MNITDATKRTLTRHPYLDRYMDLGVVNYRAVARLILPEVSKEAETSTNIQSVITALRRIPKKSKGDGKARLDNILAKSSVNLRYDMGALTISIAEDKDGLLEKVKKSPLTDGAYILLQGMESLTVVADETRIKNVGATLPEEVKELYTNLAIVVVKSPKTITKTPGVLAYLASVLAVERINVVEMMSSHAETAFIIEETDALRTVDVLRKEIKRARVPFRQTATEV